MTPSSASTVMPVRDGDDGIEVLMVRRPRAGPFGGAFVFPGGKVDPADHGPAARQAVGWAQDDELPWRAAAVRELAEEVGIFLTEPPLDRPPREVDGEALFRAVVRAGSRFDARRLTYVSNWVTPHGVGARFDTRFYVAVVPAGIDPVPAEGEVIEARWISPVAALERGRSGEWIVVLPTIRHLEMLVAAADVHSLVASLAGPTDVAPIQPSSMPRGDRVADG